MRQRNYPLDVMHNYRIQTSEAAEFASLVERVDSEALSNIASVSTARRPLLAYGAIVLDEIIRRAKPKEIVISAAGVREGLLYERLPETERAQDPLLVAPRDISTRFCHVRRTTATISSPGPMFFCSSTDIDETSDERRLRHAACLLSDVGWRAHPDYRAEQATSIVTNGAFFGVDHPGRAYLGLVAVLRHEGSEGEGAQSLRSLLTTRLLVRARVLASAIRVAYLLSASMPGVLARTPMRIRRGRLVLEAPAALSDLVNERVQNRLKALARLVGVEAAVETKL